MLKLKKKKKETILSFDGEIRYFDILFGILAILKVLMGTPKFPHLKSRELTSKTIFQ